MQHKSGMDDESHQLDAGKMNEGNRFSVSNLVTNLLNLGCQDPHSHDGAAKFLSYITGEQFQHIPRTNAVMDDSLSPKMSMPPTTKISPIPWNTSVVARTLGLVEVPNLTKTTTPTPPKVAHFLTMTTSSKSPKSPKVAQFSLPCENSHAYEDHRTSILQTSQMKETPPPKYDDPGTPIIQTFTLSNISQGSVQRSQSYFDSKAPPPSLETSQQLDSPSSRSIDSRTLAGHALIELKTSPCKQSTITAQNPMHSLFYENYVSTLERDPLMNDSNFIDLFA